MNTRQSRFHRQVAAYVARLLRKTLAANPGNPKGAMYDLGLSSTTFYRLCAKHGVATWLPRKRRRQAGQGRET